MPADTPIFQPGRILHDSIMGAFRQKGLTFARWCAERGLHVETAKQATFGQMSGPKGQKILSEMIDAAGPESVRLSYRFRMIEEAKRLQGEAEPVAA